ncbi:MAG: hypothetical protein H7067_01385 [Burkholderiales bacterium]|nr:hypothetical protein [Opitutaceae bacterium]
MSAKTNDTLYLAAGGLLLAGTCVWAFLQQSDISAAKAALLPPSSGTAYETSAIALATLESKQWPQVNPQKAGAEWLFDVFTPPVIYYNVQTKKFTVEPPVINVVSVIGDPLTPPPPPPDFGLQLVKVTQPLFRLQLVGYVGEGASARGNFENQLTGDIIFGTKGKKLPDLNLEIVSFSADRRRIQVDGGTELVVVEAVATVRDTVTGVETKLDAKVRTPEGALIVTFKNEFDGTEVSAKSGDVLSLGGYTFTVGTLDSAKPSAVVTKAGGGLVAPDQKTLEIPPPPPPVPTNVDGMNIYGPPPEGFFPPATPLQGAF